MKNLSIFSKPLLISFVIFAIAFANSIGDSAETKSSRNPVDVKVLEGRWVRPDGGYVLELREFGKEGSLTAAYFNPRPIKVFQAVWTRQGQDITLLVELRDINYPGSTYNLRYDPKSDRLKGTYFQAVERQTYATEFIRRK